MKLRELLMATDLDNVFKFINERDNQNIAPCDRPSMEKTVEGYSHVVKELMGKPKTRPYSMPILVQDSVDFLDKTPFVDVCLLNPKYVAPRKGLHPWGCKRGEKPPKGHYDINGNKHNRTFALMGVAWSKLIDTPVIIESTCSLDKALATILWELTFDGWTEKQVNENMEVLKGKLLEAERDIKKGNCIELQPKKKGQYKVVIPDCVSKQIVDIVNKYSKKKDL
jgi:hypothetical protein